MSTKSWTPKPSPYPIPKRPAEGPAVTAARREMARRHATHVEPIDRNPPATYPLTGRLVELALDMRERRLSREAVQRADFAATHVEPTEHVFVVDSDGPRFEPAPPPPGRPAVKVRLNAPRPVFAGPPAEYEPLEIEEALACVVEEPALGWRGRLFVRPQDFRACADQISVASGAILLLTAWRAARRP